MNEDNKKQPVGRYLQPQLINDSSIAELLSGTTRAAFTKPQLDLLSTITSQKDGAARLFTAGDEFLLKRRCVAIIGARDASEAGLARAKRLGRELANFDVVVMSGLAEGIDAAAMRSAIETGGSVVGVIGTSLDQSYPAKNRELQEETYQRHLLVSQFQPGERVHQSNFPKRNRLMALLSDATVVIEASNSSGTLHQAAECVRLGRWLFIARNVVENPDLTWPSRFLDAENCRILDSTSQLMKTVFGEMVDG